LLQFKIPGSNILFSFGGSLQKVSFKQKASLPINGCLKLSSKEEFMTLDKQVFDILKNILRIMFILFFPHQLKELEKRIKKKRDFFIDRDKFIFQPGSIRCYRARSFHSSSKGSNQ